MSSGSGSAARRSMTMMASSPSMPRMPLTGSRCGGAARRGRLRHRRTSRRSTSSTLDPRRWRSARRHLSFLHANQFIGAQALSKTKLSITAYPVTSGGKPGHYYKPSQMWSIAASSKAPELAVITRELHGEGARGRQGPRRGARVCRPPPKVRDLVTPSLDETSKADGRLYRQARSLCRPAAALPRPRGAARSPSCWQRLSQEVAFGSTTPEDGGTQLITEAESILKRGINRDDRSLCKRRIGRPASGHGSKLAEPQRGKVISS